VFTQNTNASKVDFWQQRTVAYDVTLAADGSADVVSTVTLVNDTPPYAQPGQDQQRGYFTRHSLPVYIQYLPLAGELQQVTINDADVTAGVSRTEERGRPYFRINFSIEPGATAVVVVRTHVPQAAVPAEGGGLRYALSIDPQGMVNQPSYTVMLRLPDGWRESSVDDDWTVNPDLSLEYDDPDGLLASTSVTMVPD
jgi:hypothetical protein